MIMNDDFYVILPSNGCTDVYPENAANKYIISWQNPIDMGGNWKVALTEANFNYIKTNTSTEYTIEYGEKLRTSIEFDVQLSIDFTTKAVHFEVELPSPKHPPYDDWQKPVAGIDAQDYFNMKAEHYFTVTFPTLDDAQICGFVKQTLKSTRTSDTLYELKSESQIQRPILPPEVAKPSKEDSENANQVFQEYAAWTLQTRALLLKKIENVRISFESYVYDHKIYSEPLTDQKVETPEGIATAIATQFESVFSKFSYKTERITFQLRDNIGFVRLGNGLNFVLGFDQVKFDNTHTVRGDHPIQMGRGINNMYIYSSACNQIHVGGIMVPLLKSIWLDVGKKDYTFGEKYCVVIKNPMYLPVAGSSINRIETNIRTDSGQLIPFAEGSVTSLTLHFKKF